MAAGTFKWFNLAKSKIGSNTLSLAASTFKAALFQSGCNLKTSASGLPRGIYNSLTNEVAAAGGYAAGGFALANESWGAGTSAKQYKFDADDLVFTATGADIANIKYLAIYMSAAASANRHLLCYVTLTASQFTLGNGNICTIQFATGGILTWA
jgi:hypothetical protein